MKNAVIYLLVTANTLPSPLILVTLMMEVTRFPETSALTRATRHQIPDDGILETSSLFVCKRNIPTGLRPIVSEVSANFCG
jgi:hypothetical protein